MAYNCRALVWACLDCCLVKALVKKSRARSCQQHQVAVPEPHSRHSESPVLPLGAQVPVFEGGVVVSAALALALPHSIARSSRWTFVMAAQMWRRCSCAQSELEYTPG